MADFRDQVQNVLEDELDQEFINRGRAAGFDPVSIHELQREYSEQDMSQDGETNNPSPFASLPKRDQRNANRMRNIGQRRPVSPAPHRIEEKQAKPKNRRKQIFVQYDEIPIDLIDQRTNDTVTVYMRSVPTTELPYLDRHDMMLQRIRQQLSQLVTRDPKTQRRVDHLAQEYNEISEEMTRFVIDMPDGLYQNLNVPTLRALQREIQNMVTGTNVDTAGDDEDEDNTDPNW